MDSIELRELKKIRTSIDDMKNAILSLSEENIKAMNAISKIFSDAVICTDTARKLSYSCKRDGEEQWIKIESEEDIPENGKWVLVKCKLMAETWWYYPYHIATYSATEKAFVDQNDKIIGYDISAEVTHWREIPKFPEDSDLFK